MPLPFKKVIENWDKRFQSEELDEFRGLVAASLTRHREALSNEAASLSNDRFDSEDTLEDYRSHLDDRWTLIQEIQQLADELAIVALYKQVELHTKRIIKRSIPNVDPRKFSNIDTLRKAMPFVIDTLPHFQAFDELRLINNAIKHEGKVSPALGSAFPAWNVGDDLAGLGAAYQRLHPLVAAYVQSFVSACYANLQPPKP